MWTDDDREQALGLDTHEQSLCGCGCGLPSIKAHDKTRAFDVEVGTCYARRAMKQVRRGDEARAEKQGWHEGWDDGRFYYIDKAHEPEGDAHG